MEAPGRQPAVERGVDECREVVGVQHLARHGNGRFTGHELALREDRLGVALDLLENLLAL
jgi:hypothetical protein